MQRPQCKAITRYGNLCKEYCRIYADGPSDYCNKHTHIIKLSGRMYFEQRQVINKYSKDIEIVKLNRENLDGYNMFPDLYEIKAKRHRELEAVRTKFLSDLEKYSEDYILSETRKRMYNRKREERRARRHVLRLQRLAQVAAQPRTLAQLAADPQNIHTSEAVNHTKKMIDIIRKIPVPEEYRWNMSTISKTMSDIITQCTLTPSAVWQMTSKYCSDETIYDLENGIYGKVLDSVWQYIIKSEHKDDLIKILKSELTDNIGMCAQGNLSRLCNILTGYLDELKPPVDRHAEFCNRIAKLADIENPVERFRLAFRLFDEYETTKEDTAHWLDALHDIDSID